MLMSELERRSRNTHWALLLSKGECPQCKEQAVYPQPKGYECNHCHTLYSLNYAPVFEHCKPRAYRDVA